jgi:hypothetical protein
MLSLGPLLTDAQRPSLQCLQKTDLKVPFEKKLRFKNISHCWVWSFCSKVAGIQRAKQSNAHAQSHLKLVMDPDVQKHQKQDTQQVPKDMSTKLDSDWLCNDFRICCIA